MRTFSNKSNKSILFLLLSVMVETSDSLDAPMPLGDTIITQPDGDITNYYTQDSSTTNPLRGSGANFLLTASIKPKKKKQVIT